MFIPHILEFGVFGVGRAQGHFHFNNGYVALSSFYLDCHVPRACELDGIHRGIGIGAARSIQVDLLGSPHLTRGFPSILQGHCSDSALTAGRFLATVFERCS